MVIVETLTFHKHPIKFVRMNWEWGVCVSIDERACLDIWDPFTFDFPDKLSYSCKMETDFLTLLKSNSAPLGFSLSPKGNLLAVMLKDKTIRIFSLQTGRCLHYLSESIKDIIRIQESPSEALHA